MTFSAAAANAKLSHWIELGKKYPILSAEEELAVGRRARDGSESARNWMILCHLRYVVKIARGYSGYGLPMADLVNEGNIGPDHRHQQVRPPTREFRFVTYASWWVRAQMQGYIMQSRSIGRSNDIETKGIFFLDEASASKTSERKRRATNPKTMPKFSGCSSESAPGTFRI